MGMYKFYPPRDMKPLWILFLFTSSDSAALNKERTPSWVNICGGTYFFSETMEYPWSTWNDAVLKCEQLDSHLLQIDNLAENFCLLEYANTKVYQTQSWHSANDIRSEGVWRQGDGTLLSWTPFWNQAVRAEPAGGTNENCGAIDWNAYDGENAGKWLVSYCDGEIKS